MAETIYYNLCQHHNNAAIVDGITVEDLFTTQSGNAPSNHSFIVPRTAYELIFLAAYAQCRINDSAPTDHWNTWEELEQAQTTHPGQLLWIAPPLYHNHLQHHTTFEQAVGQYESSTGFKQLRCRLNNLIVAQLHEAGIVEQDLLHLRLCVVGYLARQACQRCVVVQQQVRHWFSRHCTDSVTLFECDSFLSCLCDCDQYFDVGTLCAMVEYEWSRSASLIADNERLLYRAVLQNSGDDATDQRLHWTGEHTTGSTVVRSVSLGASLFAGVLYDNTACIWFYKSFDKRTVHLMPVGVAVDDVVHYPRAASALTQLCCLGETFHPRTKVVTGNSLGTSMVVGLHNTNVASLPTCLHASTFSSAASLQDQWHHMCRQWRVLEPASSTGDNVVTIVDSKYGQRHIVEFNNCASWDEFLNNIPGITTAPPPPPPTTTTTTTPSIPASVIIKDMNNDSIDDLDDLASGHEYVMVETTLPGPCSLVLHPGSLCLQLTSWAFKLKACGKVQCLLPVHMDEDQNENIGLGWLERHQSLYDEVARNIINATGVSDVTRFPPMTFLPIVLHASTLTTTAPTPRELLVFAILSGLSITNANRLALYHSAAAVVPSSFLKVASLNVAGHRTLRVWDQLLSHLRSVSPHCLALQEVPLKIVQQLSKDLGMPYWCHAAADWLNNAVISKYPLKKCESICLRVNGINGTTEMRSAVVCEVQVLAPSSSNTTVSTITLVATHLDHLSETVRFSQLQELNGVVMARTKDTNGLGLILVGDMNSVTRSDFDDGQWEENRLRREKAHLEQPKCEVSGLLREMNCVDAATGLLVGSPSNVVVETTSAYDTRVDYICVLNGDRTSGGNAPNFISVVPSSYCVVDTGTTDHKMVACSIELFG